MSRFGWAYVPSVLLSTGTVASGPTGSLQFHNSSQTLSGSPNLTYDVSSGQLVLTGTMIVSGTLYANEYHTNVVSASIIYRSGSTKFGDDAGDTHQFTGSIFGGIISGTTAQFNSIVGNGSSITSITASNITNFTTDARNQFSAGTGIQINAGVISALSVPNNSLQNSSLAIGTTSISLGATGSTIQGLTELTSSNVTGTTAQFTTISASLLSASSIAGYAIGTNVQAYDATLAAIAGASTAADTYIYFTAADTAAVGTITSFARTLLDDTSNTTARTTLGLGTMATQADSSVAITGGSINSTTIGAITQSTGQFTTLSASSTIRAGGAITGSAGLNISGGPTTIAGAAGQNMTISTALVVSGPTPTFNNPITSSGLIITGSGGLTVASSSFSFSYLNVTTNYTMTTASCIIGVSASAAITLTLPSASVVTAGRYFIIKDEAGNSGTNNITISCSAGSGDTIDNLSSSVINVNKGSYTIYRGGANRYYIV